MAKSSDYSDLKKKADEWLWIPYKRWARRLLARKQYASDPDGERRRIRLAMRKHRARAKSRSRSQLIAAVYRHEVYHPFRPIRSIR